VDRQFISIFLFVGIIAILSSVLFVKTHYLFGSFFLLIGMFFGVWLDCRTLRLRVAVKRTGWKAG
jgi:uncharacterized membrane protein